MKTCKLCPFEIKNIHSYKAHIAKSHPEHKNLLSVDVDFLNENWDLLGHYLRRRLLFLKSKNSCSQCGFNQLRQDGGMILEIDHIDGNHKNNSFSNLRVLCPNCHALTPNYRNWGRTNKEKTSTRIRKGNKNFASLRKKQQELREQFNALNPEKKRGPLDRAPSQDMVNKAFFQKKFIDVVLTTHESGEIDYSKFGWVQQLSSKLSENPQTIGRRVRTLLPDFYFKHCFRRQYSKYKQHADVP